MREINTINNISIIVDDDVYDELNKHKWNMDRTGYARRLIRLPDGSRKAIFMHRVINKTPDGLFTDHINHNKLDNRKENLRTVTQEQSKYNKMGYIRKIHDIPYKGVIFYPPTKRWCAYIQKDRKRKNIGYFHTIEEAAIAYNFWAKHLFGEYACLNQVYCR